MTRCVRLPLAILAGLPAGPALAQPSHLTMTSIFVNAAVPIKSMILILVAGMIGAIVIAVRKVSTRQIDGGSAFLSALRLGGPLLGLLGAVLNGLWGFIGIASFGQALPLAVYAPGLAEASLVLALGLLTGVVAVICNWVVESRIDRAVLRP